MYVPVYRNGAPVDTLEQRRAALIGWVYSPYRMNDLIAGILRDWVNHEGKTIDLNIYDGLQATPATQLFDSKPAYSPDLHSLFKQQRTIGFNGHQWLLVFDNIEKPFSINYTDAWTALTGGLSLNMLLFALILSMINTRANAIRIADKLTRDIKHNHELLKKSEEKLQLLLNSAAEAIYGIDMNGNCTFCNNACLLLLGYKHPEELLGKNMH
jgi:PAS domain-containing protein